MISYLATAEHLYTIKMFLRHWAPELRPHFRLIPYESVESSIERGSTVQLPGGTYIFSDFDRLTVKQRSLANLIAEAVEQHGYSVLNKPQSQLSRYELLRELYRRGINRFNVYRGDERPERFPVFIRPIEEHKGFLSGVIHSQSALDDQLAALMSGGKGETELLICEFLDVSDASGIYRKFGSFLLGDRVVQCHEFFSSNWTTKLGVSSFTHEFGEEEWRVVSASGDPHEERLKEAFEIAHVDYGRIDFGVLDGQVQIWEINTNPTITGNPRGVRPERIRLKELVHKRLSDAFLLLNDPRSETITLIPPQVCV